MGERTSHPPGTISWTDLVTSDLDAAKGFYRALLGWEFEDMPVGDGAVYSMARVDGLDVGALSRTSDQPPHWNLYVTVASADDAAARAGALGATVLAEPFDVFDAGRMAVVQDPTGAILCPWEPRRNVGARLRQRAGRADLGRPRDTGPRGRGAVLRRLARLELRDRRVRLGLPGDPQRRPAQRRRAALRARARRRRDRARPLVSISRHRRTWAPRSSGSPRTAAGRSCARRRRRSARSPSWPIRRARTWRSGKAATTTENGPGTTEARLWRAPAIRRSGGFRRGDVSRSQPRVAVAA